MIGHPNVLVAPTMTPACEAGHCWGCRGRELHGRILQVCLCPCHLGAREGPTPPPEDPIAAAAVPVEGFEPPAPKTHCPRCGWPGIDTSKQAKYQHRHRMKQ